MRHLIEFLEWLDIQESFTHQGKVLVPERREVLVLVQAAVSLVGLDSSEVELVMVVQWSGGGVKQR